MGHCKVWLDNYHTGQYYPGSQIQGKVILSFNSDTSFRSVKVRMFAREHTGWSSTEEYTENNERKTRTVDLYADNDVVSTEIILHGGHTGKTSLPAGQHIYPFSLTLPNDIPSTYNCEYGSITHKIVAIVDRPMALDYQDELIFVVVSLVDLNKIGKPDLLQPTSYSDDKTICCFCCAQGPITMDVSLPKRTLVPGETVNVAVRVTNMSNSNVEGLQLKLKQTITCKLQTSIETKTISNTLINLSEVGVGAHGEHTFTFPVQLPPNCQIPNFINCKLFKMRYKYEVIAELGSMHSNLSIETYPELGNIDIGQQASIGGFGGATSPSAYPVAPTYPTTYPNTQYPPTGGVPVYPGNSQYPPTGQYPINNYPPVANQPYPQPPGVYPPQGYPGAYAPPQTGYPSKAQEAGGYPSAPAPPTGEQYPPSYDSLQPLK